MKIAIISYNINSVWSNYGAVLHSWAFQQMLKELGYESEVLDYLVDDFQKYNFKYPALSRGKLSYKSRFFLLLNSYMYSSRYKKFNEFFDKYYIKSKNKYSNKNAVELDYDVYICESDVLWSPISVGGMDKIFFCDYPNMQDKLKIAYSVSMGDMHYNEKSLELLRDKLANFNHISVREKEGKVFLKNKTGIESKHVLDPVFLLDKDKYNILANSEPLKEEYVLVYLINRTKGLMRSAKNIADFYGVKLVIISDFFIYSYFGKTRNNSSINDFVTLFKNAKYVVTNTFHGTSFALLFNKNFVVYSRYNKNSKIKSILNTSGLYNHLIEEGTVLTKPIEVSNYIEVNNRLDEMKKKSMKFINNALPKIK